MNKSSLNRGMTLIEVLIASVILFIAIGTVSGAYKVLNHYQDINRADYALVLNQSSFYDYIDYSLATRQFNGEYDLGEYQINWSANLIANQSMIKSFDPEQGVKGRYESYGSLSLFEITYSLREYPLKTYTVSKFIVNNE